MVDAYTISVRPSVAVASYRAGGIPVRSTVATP
jgi:hypothetical protein